MGVIRLAILKSGRRVTRVPRVPTVNRQCPLSYGSYSTVRQTTVTEAAGLETVDYSTVYWTGIATRVATRLLYQLV